MSTQSAPMMFAPNYICQWQALRLRWWQPWLVLLLLVLLFALFYAGLALLLHVRPLPAKPPLWLLLLVLLVPLVALLPASRLAMRWGTGHRAGWLDSIDGRFRWRQYGHALLLSLLALLPFLIITLLWLELQPFKPEADWPWLALLLLLLIPLQAAGEEYLFRGLLSQFVAYWCRGRRLAFWLPLIVTATLFALVHGEQSIVLFVARWGLGAIFFWLSWRTGGLEAAVALHAVNNLLAFAQSLLSGTTLSSLFITDIAWPVAAMQLFTCALAARLLVWYVERKNNHAVPR